MNEHNTVEDRPIDYEKFDRIRDELRREYRRSDHRPWVIGFSGGKDSTLLTQLVFEAVLELPISQRTRPIHIVCNDTLVESPVMASFVDGVLRRIEDAVEPLLLPVTVTKTTPAHDQTFWVNMIGRGYPAPSRIFRWCTDRMKIRPTAKIIREITEGSSAGSVLLIGVRRDESSARAESIEKHEVRGALMHPHGSVDKCCIYTPIKDVSTEEVWTYLLQRRPPWGGTHRALVTLYRGALGNECPFVVDSNDAPSCGDSPSARFGCWTCTVVQKDKSLEGLIANGMEHLEALVEFRNWIKEISFLPEKRMGERRNGGKGLGPFSFETRREILRRLLEAQKEVGASLISESEIACIEMVWREDESAQVGRRVEAFLELQRMWQSEDEAQLVQLRRDGAR